jgi:hypothetical protein
MAKEFKGKIDLDIRDATPDCYASLPRPGKGRDEAHRK